MAWKMIGASYLTREALLYSWRQLAQRAGVKGGDSAGTGFEALGGHVYYDVPENVQPDKPGVIVIPCRDNAWQVLLAREEHTLDWLSPADIVPAGSKAPFSEPIPVLFWGAGHEDGKQPFAAQRADGSIVFYVDIIASTFFMLSRWEETVVPVRDHHARFPAKASVAYNQEFLDRPIIDEYALVLRLWLTVLFPNWTPSPRSFSVKLSHDIDTPQLLPHWQGRLQVLGRDLFKQYSLKQALRTTKNILQDPYFKGIHDLASLSRKYDIESAFYFMAAKPGPHDNGYDPASQLIRRCIDDLREQGFEIGFHPGYSTFDNPEQLAAEKMRLDMALGETKYGGRQHVLRFQAPDTWRHWEQVGLTYDSTMAYADHEGFRCGTCHPFRPFDLQEDRELNLWEWPLIVMDGTLYQYRKLTPEQGQKEILKLAERCKQVEGTFTLLWHNSSLAGEWREWADMYRQVVSTLSTVSRGN